MVAAIFPSFPGLVKVIMACYWLANIAAPVSLFLLGLQTIWAHSECISRAPHASSPSIWTMSVDYPGTHIPMPKLFLNRPDVVPIFL